MTTLNYVLFDGSSHYVVDENTKNDLTAEDSNIEVLFKAYSIDACQDVADDLNERL